MDMKDKMILLLGEIAVARLSSKELAEICEVFDKNMSDIIWVNKQHEILEQ
jgi:hypothetical protein